jgi:pyridoxine 5-phosphate synthase
LRAAKLALEAGADNVTAHLREDRRHIRDADIEKLAKRYANVLNMEMAVTREMLAIAGRIRPHACCLVPERREEITTEGGLDAKSQEKALKPFVSELRGKGIQVALFIDPDREQVEASKRVGADAFEIHTGAYCRAALAGDKKTAGLELKRIEEAAKLGAALGLEVHAGHGLTYESVGPVAAIPEIVELNIGHFLVGEAIFVGFAETIKKMRRAMDEARYATQTVGEEIGV